MRMRCTCCGQWTIEAVRYDLAARKARGALLVLRHGTVAHGDYRSVPELEAALRLYGAPRLDQFEDC